MSTLGPQGIQGSAGIPGTIGPTGSTGTLGSQGYQGIQGAIGPQGVEGYIGINTAGLQGWQGLQGQQGFQGTLGFEGRQGDQGIPIPGAQGIQGYQASVANAHGYDGVFGNQGRTGAQGPSSYGIQGLLGLTGTKRGAQGPQGIQGTQGSQGFQGTTTAGTQGSQGVQGKNLGVTGYQGLVGLQGRQAILGTQGPQGGGGFYKIDPTAELIFYDDFVGPTIAPRYSLTSNGTFTIATSYLQGVAELKSGATTVGGFMLATTNSDTWLYANTTQLPTFAVSISLRALTNSKVVIGLTDNNKVSTINNGFYFKFDYVSAASTWDLVKEIGGVVNTYQPAIKPSTTDFQKLKIIYTPAAGGTAEFYIDGTLIYSHTGTISTKLKPIVSIEPKGTSARYLYIDYLYLKLTRG